jgi:hypothetical protein
LASSLTLYIFTAFAPNRVHIPITDWMTTEIKTILDFYAGMSFDDFCLRLRGLFGSSALKLYFMEANALVENRVKITNENYDELLLRIINEGKDISKPTPYICVFRSTENSSPDKLPALPFLKAEGSVSSRGTDQTDFRLRILFRDGDACVFCDASENLTAAHLIGYSSKETEKLVEDLQRVNISGINDTMNGITLCGACHLMFDNFLVCIHPSTNRIEVAQCLRSSIDYGMKWTALNGRNVVPRTKCGNWVTNELLERQYELFKQTTEERQLEALQKPLVCTCGFRTNSKGGLAKHKLGTKHLGNQQGSLKPSMLYTPSK